MTKYLRLMLTVLLMIYTVVLTVIEGTEGIHGKLNNKMGNWGYYITWKDILVVNNNIKNLLKKEMFDLRGKLHLYKLGYCKISLIPGFGKNAIKMSASSDQGRGYEPHLGIVNAKGDWNPSKYDKKQYLQVELPYISWITGISTQGRYIGNQYITSYRDLYSYDCKIWKVYGKGNGQVFKGNTNHTGIKKNEFNVPFTAKCVRVNPLTWHGYIGMRMDVIGCTI